MKGIATYLRLKVPELPATHDLKKTLERGFLDKSRPAVKTSKDLGCLAHLEALLKDVIFQSCVPILSPSSWCLLTLSYFSSSFACLPWVDGSKALLCYVWEARVKTLMFKRLTTTKARWGRPSCLWGKKRENNKPVALEADWDSVADLAIVGRAGPTHRRAVCLTVSDFLIFSLWRRSSQKSKILFKLNIVQYLHVKESVLQWSSLELSVVS